MSEEEIKDNKEKEAQAEEGTAENLEAQLEELNDELQQQKEKYLRLFAEFENYKKRTTRERLELIKTASEDTIHALLPVLDDFDRAKKSADDENTEEYFSEGIQMVYSKLNKVMESKGLKAMESDGEDFDPELHEAITEIPAPTEEMKGKVIDTIEKGYFLHDKIIRFAKVVVGK